VHHAPTRPGLAIAIVAVVVAAQAGVAATGGPVPSHLDLQKIQGLTGVAVGEPAPSPSPVAAPADRSDAETPAADAPVADAPVDAGIANLRIEEVPTVGASARPQPPADKPDAAGAAPAQSKPLATDTVEESAPVAATRAQPRTVEPDEPAGQAPASVDEDAAPQATAEVPAVAPAQSAVEPAAVEPETVSQPAPASTAKRAVLPSALDAGVIRGFTGARDEPSAPVASETPVDVAEAAPPAQASPPPETPPEPSPAPVAVSVDPAPVTAAPEAPATKKVRIGPSPLDLSSIAGLAEPHDGNYTGSASPAAAEGEKGGGSAGLAPVPKAQLDRIRDVFDPPAGGR
jgi:hypothetical protein